MPTAKFFSSLLALMALLASFSTTGAETIHCTPITSVPFDITVPGVYCLTRNLGHPLSPPAGSSYAIAISIHVSDVVVDLNGFTLKGFPADQGVDTFGITLATNVGPKKNVTIKNGTVYGFGFGIDLLNVTDCIVERIRAEANLVGIEAGRRCIVRDNLVVGPFILEGNFGTTGIGLGAGSRALNNDVTNTSLAIQGINNDDVLAVNNRITHSNSGIILTGNSKYRDNLTFGVDSPYFLGIDAGNNN